MFQLYKGGAITMITRKALVVIVLFALFVFVVPALSQDIKEVVRSGDLEKVKGLLEKEPKLVNVEDNRNCTPLHFASEGGHKEIAQLLIANGAEIDATEINSHTPLHYAVRNGKVELAELLLANGPSR